jgi:hypothetical protein
MKYGHTTIELPVAMLGCAAQPIADDPIRRGQEAWRRLSRSGSSPPAPPAPAMESTSPLRQAKPPVELSGYTLAVMGDVKPVSLSEELNDEIGF